MKSTNKHNKQIMSSLNGINAHISTINNLMKKLENFHVDFLKVCPDYFEENSSYSKHLELKKQEYLKQLSDTALQFILEPKLDVDLTIATIKDNWDRKNIEVTIENYDESKKDKKDKHDSSVFDFIDNVVSNYCISLSPKDITYITFSIKTANPRELSYITIILAPGFSYATFSNDKAGWDSNILLNNNFLSAVCAELD